MGASSPNKRRTKKGPGNLGNDKLPSTLWWYGDFFLDSLTRVTKITRVFVRTISLGQIQGNLHLFLRKKYMYLQLFLSVSTWCLNIALRLPNKNGMGQSWSFYSFFHVSLAVIKSSSSHLPPSWPHLASWTTPSELEQIWRTIDVAQGDSGRRQRLCFSRISYASICDMCFTFRCMNSRI